MNNLKIKVLIVDDECIVRKGIQATVDWDEYDMEVVADVPNGEKGWEAFQEFRPDVIITDIVMPEMDGIEFSRKVKQHSPDIKILLLSCHRDFEYAQEGLKIGVSGYLLKTSFNDKELNDYLQQFHDEIKARKRSILNTFKSFEKTNSSFYVWLCGFNSNFEAELENWFETDWSWMENPFHVYFVRSTARENNCIVWELIQKHLNGKGEMIRYGSEQCFLFCDGARKQELDMILINLKNTLDTVQWNRIGPASGMDGWVNAVKSLYRQAEIEKNFAFETISWPDPIIQAVQLITVDISSPLTVTEVAKQVGLSRSHFSTLFKKVIGESFGSFTEKMKLKVATELLGTTKMNIEEIAIKVGMCDAKYFSKWFKRCIGMPPSQYRIKQKDELEYTN
ncbi:response regulator transcription factor [Pseudalkalibacillus decolorationis]|uniref:response regulator transcription factor n=1 Tax=Pseudalkalibacillus decolorationis TaxID=163879 RepID=UPI002149100B|nr:response regulator [Pseudalkalibacillus decolorationis]